MRRSTWPTMAIHGMPATGLPTILGSITPSGRIRPSTTAVPPICIWGRVAGGVNRLFRRGRGTATPAGVAVPRPRLPTKCQAFHQGDRRHPHGKLAQKLCLTLGPPYVVHDCSVNACHPCEPSKDPHEHFWACSDNNDPLALDEFTATSKCWIAGWPAQRT